MTLTANDQAVAYINDAGNLTIARPDRSEARELTRHGLAFQPAWSPDGRYIAYVMTEPLDAGATPDQRRYAMQLRIVEVDRPANEGLLLATTESESVPAWQRQRILAPQWSPDGNYIYFAWAGPDHRAAQVLRVDVPRQGNGVNIRALRIDAPRNEAFLPPGLRALAIERAAPDVFFGGFVALANGDLVLQQCRGAAPACGLFVWSGSEPRPLLRDTEGTTLSLAGRAPDGVSVFAYAFGPENADVLARVSPAGERQDLFRIDRSRAGGLFFSRPVAVAFDGRRLLLETQAQPRALVALDLVALDAGDRPWAAGHSPAWFTVAPAGLLPALNPPLPTTSLATPVPSPTPAPPTPLPGNFDLEVRVASGGCVVGREVVATIRNVGTGAFPSQGVIVRVQTPVRFVLATVLVPDLALGPGESREVRTGHTLQSGVIAQVVLDPDQVLRETNVANNLAECRP